MRRDWRTERITFDPNLTALVIRGGLLRKSHQWRMVVRTRAQRAVRRTWWVREACFLAVVLGVVLGTVYVLGWTD
jgi:hypothetical protein